MQGEEEWGCKGMQTRSPVLVRCQEQVESSTVHSLTQACIIYTQSLQFQGIQEQRLSYCSGALHGTEHPRHAEQAVSYCTKRDPVFEIKKGLSGLFLDLV